MLLIVEHFGKVMLKTDMRFLRKPTVELAR